MKRQPRTVKENYAIIRIIISLYKTGNIMHISPTRCTLQVGISNINIIKCTVNSSHRVLSIIIKITSVLLRFILNALIFHRNFIQDNKKQLIKNILIVCLS